jgi:hypothetical protein
MAVLLKAFLNARLLLGPLHGPHRRRASRVPTYLDTGRRENVTER